MKEVLEYLFARLRAERPVTHKVEGVTYAVTNAGTLGEPVLALEPQWDKPTMEVATLNALANLSALKVDGLDARAAFWVKDYRTVQLVALDADDYGRRHVWGEAKHTAETPFCFGNYYTPEDFLIKFRASFLFTDDAVKVQQLCSTVGSGEAVLVADDGISQEVTIKAGTVTRSSISLPAEGVALVPWRTFREVNPVESRFLLRMKAVKDSLPAIALFEIDAKWRLDTLGAVAGWLLENAPGVPVIC